MRLTRMTSRFFNQAVGKMVMEFFEVVKSLGRKALDRKIKIPVLLLRSLRYQIDIVSIKNSVDCT